MQSHLPVFCVLSILSKTISLVSQFFSELKGAFQTAMMLAGGFRKFRKLHNCGLWVEVRIKRSRFHAIEIDTSLTAKRLIRVFERLQVSRGLPDILRVDNGPEFISSELVTWAESAGMMILYIQPGEPNQNAYIERFNRTYREEVLDLYLFRDLAEVRETTYWWIIDYNEQRPHDALGDLTPAEYMEQNAGNSILQLST